jgi:hypothetical protein
MVDLITEWEYYEPISEEYTMNDYERLINNAWEAHHSSTDEWAANYWKTVAKVLTRKFQAGAN